MALTPQEITFYAGDTRTVVIPLKNDSDASAFTPTGYNLIFTAKASNAASDNGAKFQYSTGAGITHSTTNASTVFHPVDTRAHGGKTLYWDIQAEHLTNPDDVRTVAVGTLVLKRDTTRQTTTSVPLHTISESVPYTGPTGETPLVTSTTPPSDHDAIWFDPETGGFSVWYVDAWVAVGEGGAGGPPTAAEITAALQGAEADPTKIGAEYMPEALTLDSLTLGDTSADTLPVGAIGGTGTDGEIAWHNNSDAGGIKFQMARNQFNGWARIETAEINAGVVFAEIGRFRLEPSEIQAAVGGYYMLTGTVVVNGSADLTGTAAIGVHIDGTAVNGATKGVYVGLTENSVSIISNRITFAIPIKIADRTSNAANTFRLETGTVDILIHFMREILKAGAAIESTNTGSAASSNSGATGDASTLIPQDFIFSLRTPTDAAYSGYFEAIAVGCQLRRIA